LSDPANVLGACIRLSPDECSPDQIRRLVELYSNRIDPELANNVMAFERPRKLALSTFVRQAQVRVGSIGGDPGV